MDNPANTPGPAGEVTELRAQCDALRHQVLSLLILLLVVSGTLNLFFWRQYRNASGALNVEGPQVSQMLADYNKNSAPVINNFVTRLQDFEKKNPDFGPILAKYGIRPGTFTGGPPPTATAPAPAKKK